MAVTSKVLLEGNLLATPDLRRSKSFQAPAAPILWSICDIQGHISTQMPWLRTPSRRGIIPMFLYEDNRTA